MLVVGGLISEALLVPIRGVARPSELFQVSTISPGARAASGLAPISTVANWQRAGATRRIAAITPSRIVARVRSINAEYVSAVHVSQNFFDVLGLAVHGGGLSPEEYHSANKSQAIASFDFWKRILSSRVQVGESFELYEPRRTVRLIGILPEGFRLPTHPTGFDLMFAGEKTWDLDNQGRPPRLLPIVRIPPDDVAAAEADFSRVLTEDPATGPAVRLIPLFSAQGETSDNWLRGSMVATGVVFVLVVIGLLTITEDVLEATSRRARLCFSLGARWPRVLLDTSSGAALGFLVGGLAAFWLALTIQRWTLVELSTEIGQITTSLTAKRIAITIFFSSVLLFVGTHIIPAVWRLRSVERETLFLSSYTNRLGIAGTTFQIAVGTTALSLACAVIFNLQDRWRALGHEYRDLVLVELRGPVAGSAQRARDYIQEIRQDVRVLEVAVIVDSLYKGTFLANENWSIPFGATSDCLGGPKYSVTQNFFALVGLRVAQGSLPVAEPVDGVREAAINEATARACFPRRSALGQRVTVGGAQYKIVAISRDASFVSLLGEPEEQEFYRVDPNLPESPVMTLLIKARPGALDSMVVELYSQLIKRTGDDSGISVVPAGRAIRVSGASLYLALAIVGGMSIAAVVVIIISIFGAARAESIRRRREIGVRLMLGAPYVSIWVSISRPFRVASFVGLPLGAVGGWIFLEIANRRLDMVTSSWSLVVGVAVILAVLGCGVRAGAGWLRRAPVAALVHTKN